MLPPVPSERYPVITTVRSKFDTFLASLPELAASAAVLLERAQQIFSPEISAALADMVKNLHDASRRLPATMQHVDALLGDLQNTSQEARKLATSLQGTTADVGPQISKLTERLTPRPTISKRPARASTALWPRTATASPSSRRMDCRSCSARWKRRAARRKHSAICRAA